MGQARQRKLENAQRQAERRNSRTPVLLSLLMVLAAAMAFSFVSYGSDEESSSKMKRGGALAPTSDELLAKEWGTEHLAWDFTLPPIELLDTTPNFVPAKKWESWEQAEQQVKNALRLIWSVRHSPVLKTQDDREIMAYFKPYIDRGEIPPISPAPKVLEDSVFMTYRCISGDFTVGSQKVSVSYLATVFYHEAQHAALCEQKMREFGFTDREQMREYTTTVDRCEIEAPADAAGIRMFEALRRSSLLDRTFSLKPDGGDPIRDIYAKWKDLRKGDGAYCAALYDTYRASGMKEVPGAQ